MPKQSHYRAVGVGELGLLRPGRTRAREDVGRALVRVSLHDCPKHAHHHHVARDGGGVAEVATLPAAGRGELGLLGPGRARTREDVGRALVGVRAHVIKLRSDHHRVAGDGDRCSEVVVRLAVAAVRLASKAQDDPVGVIMKAEPWPMLAPRRLVACLPPACRRRWRPCCRTGPPLRRRVGPTVPASTTSQGRKPSLTAPQQGRK